MKNKNKYNWLLLALPIIFIVWFFVQKSHQEPIRTLPYFGKKNSMQKGDTVYHTVKPFCFTNQHNQKITESTVQNKIYVTDFFFTTCQSICPVMSTQLERVYKTFENNPEVLILSHTVEPEVDSVPLLLKYAKLHGVTNSKWHFLTGEKQQLYSMARSSYLLNNDIGNGDESDFIHTQNFALVDYDRHLRGFYDGTDSADVTRLILEIKLLLQEYHYKFRNN